MNAYVAKRSIDVDRIASILEAHGLDSMGDDRWSHGAIRRAWGKDDTTVAIIDDARSMSQLLLLEGETEELALQLVSSLDLITPAQVLEAIEAACTVPDRIRALYRAHILRFVGGEIDAELVNRQCASLSDDTPWIRWAAARLLDQRVSGTVLRAFATASTRFPELRGSHARMEERMQAMMEGTHGDSPTDAWHELLSRARSGFDADQPKRAAMAMDALLKGTPAHPEALYWRARAYVSEGRRGVAKALFGAAEVCARLERDAREGDAQAQAEEVLTLIGAARADVDEVELVDTTILDRWLLKWAADGQEAALCGAALAVIDVAADRAAVTRFAAGRYRHDRRHLERAHAEAPASRWCARALANTLKTEEPERAIALFHHAMASATVGLSEEEQLMDRMGDLIEKANFASAQSIEAGLLEDLAGVLYDERRWNEAIGIADRLVEENPDNTTGWQWRANARTFALRFEEAATAYRVALKQLDRAFASDGLVVGGDPRPGMRFNLSCVLAKLGKRAAALDELRRSVRADPKWGHEARADAYFEALWGDELFLQITDGKPEALIFDEERTVGHIDELVGQAIRLCHHGDYLRAIEIAQRAGSLAAICQQSVLEARALSIEGRAHACSGEGEQALAKSIEAERLAEGSSADIRAEIIHEVGTAHHAAGRFEEARAAYERSLALRKDAHGGRHPIVAKSLGDIARVQTECGEEATSTLRDGIEILQSFLGARSDSDLDLRKEATVDLAILLSNLAEDRRRAGDLDEAIDAIDRCVQSIEGAIVQDVRVAQPVLDHAVGTAELVRKSTVGAQRERARGVVEHLESLLLTGTTEQRHERAFWSRIRRIVRGAVKRGVPEALLARVLTEALRGGTSLPKELRRAPEIAGLRKALAERAKRYPTLLAMAVIALATAEANGHLDEALENLQELCVSTLG